MRFLSRDEVLEKIGGVSYQTLWTWMRDGKFPRSREIGENKVGWLETEVEHWMQHRPVRRLKGDVVA